MRSELIQRTITGFAIGLFFFYSFFYLPVYVSSFLLFTVLVLILLFEMPKLYDYTKPWAWFVTLLYPIMPFVLLIVLNQHYYYHILVALIFAISFVHDVGAYFIGKLFGKHKLCPSISPKKTIEGFIGGWISIYILFFILALYEVTEFHVVLTFFLSFLFATAATAGDIFESWLKRRAGIKDSGNLLPGHGGLLDRFDSILAVTVLVYIFVLLSF